MCYCIAEIFHKIFAQAHFFMPKYYERTFRVSPKEANYFMSYMSIIKAVMCFGGGYLFAKYIKVNSFTARKYVLGAEIISVVGGMLYYFISCPNSDLAGIGPDLSDSDYNLNSTIEDCNCKVGKYSPVCSNSGKEFMTACYGQCKDNIILNDHTNQSSVVYTDCYEYQNMSSTYCTTVEQHQEKCTAGLIAAFVLELIMTLKYVIYGVVTMALVGAAPFEEKVLSLALYKLIPKVCAELYASKMTGAIIETTCILWAQDDCHHYGHCLLYDRTKLRYRYITNIILPLICVTICYCGLYVFKPRKYSKCWYDMIKHEKEINTKKDEIKEIK